MLFRATENQHRTGLAILRVGVAIIFFMHGWLKFTKMGHTGLTGFFTQSHVPLPALTAWVNMILETAGAVALAAGLGTRIVAVLFACDMLGAILMIHLKNGFFLPTGYEFVLLLMIASITLAIAGGGAATVDDVIARRKAVE